MSMSTDTHNGQQDGARIRLAQETQLRGKEQGSRDMFVIIWEYHCMTYVYKKNHNPIAVIQIVA